MSNYSFTTMPSVSISRSRFRRTSTHKTSFNLGQIIPIYVDEVLPGDTRSLDLSALIRMSQPIAPIMDNIVCDFYAFFVPNRIVWDHWRDFLGENNVSAGIPASTYTVPTMISFNTAVQSKIGSYADYMGLPATNGNIADVFNHLSVLPFRALAKTYNRWFRNENVIAPLAVLTSDIPGVLVGVANNYFLFDNNYVLKAAKIADYFTSALPYAQKGSPVSIPLGTSAPILVKNTSTGAYLAAGNNLDLRNISDVNPTSKVQVQSSGLTSWTGDLIADLSQATAATINQLRYAFQLQKLLEKDALYGTKYWSILASHFGVDAPDASIQDPEYLGGKRMHINVDQVLQTTGFNSTPSSNQLGTPGANSVTGFSGSLFTKSFVEHGTLLILMVARQESHTYSQGINRMWSRSGRYDFYWPVFANLGAQAVKKKEIYFGATDPEGVFGYQEAWAEYRFKPSIATGLLNPSRSGSLNYWTLAENFTSEPTLSQTFIEEDRSNLVRALVTGSNGPDFIADVYFEDVAVRPMPTYSIPGLIDHH